MEDIKLLIIKNKGDLPTESTLSKLLDLPAHFQAYVKTKTSGKFKVRDNLSLEL
jgi:hypothetical protein